ncbi:MAG: DNA polymerase III subunit gamma/tau [Candidatus Marinimicrobia bacterium]|nr:DNA polymerase III subunit gamma/tau [Candidatus Neomarinimicrobiota bacterium]
MSHQVISLKYRPQQFEDVIGQEHITITLKNAIQKNRLGHAYIFSGPRGTGKTTTARLLAKVVNCESPKNGNPCNVCSSCREITEGRSMDVLEIDGASNRGIDSIRDLREQVKYPPTRGKYKVYIIDEFHQITKDAFNALLKTLEEPPKHILFIFATTELHKVLPTILSRCQRFEFKRIPLLQIMDLLRGIARQEGIAIDDDALLLIAKKGDGSIRDSESILEQVIAFSNEDISYEAILNMLGVIREDVFFTLFAALNNGDAGAALQLIDDMLMQGYDLTEFLSMFSVFLRDLYMVKAHGSADILNTTENLKHEYLSVARAQDERTLIRMLSIVNEEMPAISRSANTKILTEALFIKLSRMKDFVDLDRVLTQLKNTPPPAAAPAEARRESTPPKASAARPYQSPILHAAPKTEIGAAAKDRPAEKTPPPAALPEDPAPGPGTEKTPELTLDIVRERWQEIIDCMQPKKPAVAGLLCQVGLTRVTEDTLYLAAENDYAYQTIHSSEQIIRSCIKTVLGAALTVRVEKNKVAQDQKVSKKESIDEAAKMVMQSFEGELV